jgi:fatty-acid desaturase
MFPHIPFHRVNWLVSSFLIGTLVSRSLSYPYTSGFLASTGFRSHFSSSLCHYIGAQPYSSKCSARDSWILAIVTFGEGYHNYHREFQHDYRNGVEPWQIDPTKWIIWILSKIGSVSNSRYHKRPAGVGLAPASASLTANSGVTAR